MIHHGGRHLKQKHRIKANSDSYSNAPTSTVLVIRNKYALRAQMWVSMVVAGGISSHPSILRKYAFDMTIRKPVSGRATHV